MFRKFGENYEKVKDIGFGGQGSVGVYKDKQGNKVVAKIIMQKNQLNEAYILSKCNHRFIVNYLEHFFEDGQQIIVMEYCECGDLNDFIAERRKTNGAPFLENTIMNWFIQILLALEKVHDQKLIHRDIKTRNIFVTSNWTVKLGDFGIACSPNANSQWLGTSHYLSPEIWNNGEYSDKSDIWALGCVLYDLCTFRHPFTKTNEKSLEEQICNSEPNPIDTKHYSTDLQKLIKYIIIYIKSLLLKKDPKKRPSINEIYEIPYVVERFEKLIDYLESQEEQKDQQVDLYEDDFHPLDVTLTMTDQDKTRTKAPPLSTFKISDLKESLKSSTRGSKFLKQKQEADLTVEFL